MPEYPIVVQMRWFIQGIRDVSREKYTSRRGVLDCGRVELMVET